MATLTGANGSTVNVIVVDTSPITQSLLAAAISVLTTAATVVEVSATTVAAAGSATPTIVVPPNTVTGTLNIAVLPTQTGVLSLPSTGYAGALISTPNPITVVGNGGSNQVIQASSNSLVYNTGGGTGTVSASGSGNLVGTPTTGSGAYTYNLTGTNDTVTAFTGNNTVGAMGSNALVGATNGNDIINVGAANDTVIIGTGVMTVNVSVGGSAIIGAIDQNGQPTSGNLTFINASSTGSTIFGGAGSDTINGGPGTGGVFVGGSAGNNSIISGTGNTTIFAGGSGDVVSLQGAGNDSIFAASGNESLFAGGATGNDTFVFIDGLTKGGNDIISNFTSADTLSTIGYGAPQITTNATGGITSLTLSDGTKITFNGTLPTQSQIHSS